MFLVRSNSNSNSRQQQLLQAQLAQEYSRGRAEPVPPARDMARLDLSNGAQPQHNDRLIYGAAVGRSAGGYDSTGSAGSGSGSGYSSGSKAPVPVPSSRSKGGASSTTTTSNAGSDFGQQLKSRGAKYVENKIMNMLNKYLDIQGSLHHRQL